MRKLHQNSVSLPQGRQQCLRIGQVLCRVLVCGGLLFAISCRKEPTPVGPVTESDVLAKVGETVIDVKTFEAELNRRSRATPGRYATPEQREALLQEMVQKKVLFEKARAAGYTRKEELLRNFEEMVIAKYEAENKPAAALPTAREIEEYYQRKAGEFKTSEKIRVAILQLKGSTNAIPEKQAALRERAAGLRAEAVAAAGREATFGDLARQYSEDLPTRYKGGDCGWIERGGKLQSWPGPVMEAIFALENVGEISPVVQANGNCYLLKLIERSPAGVRPLAEVRELIAHRLAQQKQEEAARKFVEQSTAGLQVEVHPEALVQVHPPEAALAKAPVLPPRTPTR